MLLNFIHFLLVLLLNRLNSLRNKRMWQVIFFLIEQNMLRVFFYRYGRGIRQVTRILKVPFFGNLGLVPALLCHVAYVQKEGAVEMLRTCQLLRAGKLLWGLQLSQQRNVLQFDVLELLVQLLIISLHFLKPIVRVVQFDTQRIDHLLFFVQFRLVPYALLSQLLSQFFGFLLQLLLVNFF